jgi:glycosyltransferase involved in cell wall biosynthesis
LPSHFSFLEEQLKSDLKNYQKALRKIVSSPPLLKFLQKKGIENLYLCGNGIFFDFYNRVFNFNLERWRKGYKIKHVAYIGGTHEIDWKLFLQIVKENPDLTFFLIGPLDKKTENYPENLKIVGKVPYLQVFEFLKKIDLGIVPFLQNEVTSGVDPIKIYEFAASGVPVISTPFFEGLPSWVFKTDAMANDFRKLINKIEKMNGNLSYSYFLRNKSKLRDWNRLFSQFHFF